MTTDAITSSSHVTAAQAKKKNHCNWLPLHFSCRWRLISMQMRADFFRFKTISFNVIIPEQGAGSETTIPEQTTRL